MQGWGENDRGVSYTFGPDSVTEFLQKHDLDLICRAHQVRAMACLGACQPTCLGACQPAGLRTYQPVLKRVSLTAVHCWGCRAMPSGGVV